MTAPHVQRCTHRQAFGVGEHARTWQCEQNDPHPSGEGHLYPIEATRFGRVLHQQRPEWLAAQLVDVARREAFLTRQLDEATAAAVQLVRAYADEAHGVPIGDDVRRWVARHAPTYADALGWTDPEVTRS